MALAAGLIVLRQSRLCRWSRVPGFGRVNRVNSSIREDSGTKSAGGLRYITQVWIKGKFRPVSSGQGLMETASKGRSVR